VQFENLFIQVPVQARKGNDGSLGSILKKKIEVIRRRK